MKRESFKISIIIPCYNVQAFIDRCLQSIIQQTIGLPHLEIILVNDASTDGTLDRLFYWEKQYPENIMVITYEQNLRQGGARNVGLSYATGDYIGFVDADDWIELDMYEKLESMMEEECLDVVRCQMVRDSGKEKKSFYEPEFGGIYAGLYRKEIVYNYGVVFPEGLSYEDNYWGQLLKYYIKSEKKIEEALYHYYINPNSTVTKRNDMTQLDRMTIEEMLLDAYIERGFFEADKDHIFKEFLERYYLNTWFIIFTRFDDVPDILLKMVHTIAYYFSDYRERITRMQFSDRAHLLIEMLLEPEHHNVYEVKLKWLTSWLKEQGLSL